MAETFGSINLNDLMQKAGSNWTGTFGTDSFRPAAIATAEQRATKNAPLNDSKQASSFPSTPMPELNREANFRQNEHEAAIAGQRASQQMIGGAEQLSRIAASNYQTKTNIDEQSKAFEYARQLNNNDINQRNAFNNNNAISNAKYEDLRNSKSLSNNNLDNQLRLMREQNTIDQSNKERQNYLNNIATLNNYTQQASEAAKQRLSNQQIAQTQANAGIYSSMFGALSGPGANYKYWS